MANTSTKTRSARDVATLLGKSRHWVSQQIDAGELKPSIVTARSAQFTPADIRDFCRRHAAKLREEAKEIAELGRQVCA